MPLKLNVSVSKKLGLPEYSSIGASCSLELELSEALLRLGPGCLPGAGARRLHRLQSGGQRRAGPAPGVAGPSAVEWPLDPGQRPRPGRRQWPDRARTGGARGRSRKPATPSQVRAIVAIARAQHADLEGILRAEYAVTRPEDLSLAEASQLIDQLKAAAQV